ncbi:MAG: PA2169 family four-helix-bundle protein [Caulobacteraceae bacterium]
MSDNHETHVLNSLIETVIDSSDGYRKAGEAAENSRFKTLFLERVRMRSELARKLQAEVRHLGGTPDEDGTVLAKAHRTFLALKDTVTGRDDKAVITEVERGESFIKGKFDAAVKEGGLSPQTKHVIEAGRIEIRAQHEQVTALKNAIS